MGKRNKKNRQMVNVFSDDEDISNSKTQQEPDSAHENNQQEEKKKKINPFQLLESTSDKEVDDDEFIQIKKKEKYSKPTESKPTESKPTESKPTESKPTEIQTNKSELIISKNTLYSKAIQMEKSKNYDMAIQFYQESVEIEKNPKAAHNLALLYEDFKKYNDAMTYYKIACDMNHHYSYCNLAILLMEQKFYKEAEPYFIRSIRNGDFDIIESYIEYLSLTNKREEAFQLLEKYKNYTNMDKEIKELFAKCVKLPTDYNQQNFI